MRDFLFRGKTKQGKWVEGNGIMQGQDCISYARWVDICDDKMRYEVIPESVSEFTGLTDKNGKKIFEGDIVRYTRTNMYAPSCSFHGQTIVSLHKILWDSSISAFVSQHYSLSEKRIVGKGSAVLYDDRAKANIVEVIGNIHDNPELLGETK